MVERGRAWWWGFLLAGMLVVWVAPPAWSDGSMANTTDRTVVFHTSPEGAQIELTGSEDMILGYSGKPIYVPIPTDHDTTLHFTFNLAGYQKGSLEVSTSALRDESVHTLPESGSLTLQPASMARYFFDQLLHHYAVLGLLIVGLGLVAWRATRLVKETRQQARRNFTVLDTMQVKTPTLEDFSLVGQRLGNYLLSDKLGKGGMAVVYRGLPHDTLDATHAVAIKVINQDHLNSPESKARFEREVRIGAKLSHPNIVRLIDWDISGPFYLVMELIDGEPLRKRIRPDGMAPIEAMTLMHPVFEAMIYAHEMGVWHRDLKPENIFISDTDRITVMDFGISRQASDVTVTATDQMPVTPGYMSPEQFSGKNVAAPSDQYTLGIMMWELIVGHRPFEDESPLVVVMKHLTAPLPPLREHVPEVAEEVEWVVDRMCSKDPLQRYPDLRSALQALEDSVGWV